MENIIFCIVFAFSISFGCIICLAIAIIKMDKINKSIIFLLSLLTAFSLCCSCYFSLDLVLKDFVTESGMYVKSHRENFYERVFFDTGKDKYQGYNVFSNNETDLFLEKGFFYKYVYAKRTGVLISVEKQSGTQSGDG